jgi:hypothetical protein
LTLEKGEPITAIVEPKLEVEKKPLRKKGAKAKVATKAKGR